MDLESQAEERGQTIVHNLPLTEAMEAEQNYQRGFISACEWILELSEDLRQWKESSK